MNCANMQAEACFVVTDVTSRDCREQLHAWSLAVNDP
jgi:hypothetical protein